MPTIAYSAAEHSIYITTYDDITFVGQGEPDADFIGIEFVNDSVTSVEGAKGEVQDSIRVAKMGRVTFTNQWGSNFNDVMNQVNKDQQAGNYMKSLTVKRTNETTGVNDEIMSCVNPKIVKLPNYSIGVSASDRTYVYNVHNMEMKEVEAPA